MTESAIGRNLDERVEGSLHAGWLVVLGSMLALIVGNGPIILFTFGTLLQPISSEFGWQRSVLASAVVTAHVAGAVVMPFVGILIDRVGVRRVAMPAVVIFAAA